MSTRTIIEINHDRIHELRDNGQLLWLRLLVDLASCDMTVAERLFFEARGIRVLGQRHHSETLKLEVA